MVSDVNFLMFQKEYPLSDNYGKIMYDQSRFLYVQIRNFIYYRQFSSAEFTGNLYRYFSPSNT